MKRLLALILTLFPLFSITALPAAAADTADNGSGLLNPPGNAIVVPGSEEISPRIDVPYTLNFPTDNECHTLASGLSISGNTTVTVSGNWYPSVINVYVQFYDPSTGNARSVLLRNGVAATFTISTSAIYTLRVSASYTPIYTIDGHMTVRYG